MKTFVLVLAFLLAAPAARAQTVMEYGAACASEAVAVPAFRCEDGTPVPITVNGSVPTEYTPGMSCDRPALLPPDPGQKTDGQCVPYSRALVLRDDSLGQVSAFCRQKKIRSATSPLYDEIDVIAHNARNGNTCWFQATVPGPLATDKGVDGRKVPSPTSVSSGPGFPDPAKFWNAPAQTAKLTCVSCHDSGPFMYSPFIAQARAVPSDPFGPYNNDVGAVFKAWPKAFGVSTDGNTCTGCHRMGNMESCHTTMYQSFGAKPVIGLDAWGHTYPQSHWMPPGDLKSEAQWHQAYDDSIARIGACCENPGAAGCKIVRYDRLGK